MKHFLDCSDNILDCILVDRLFPLIFQNSNVVVYFLTPELVFHLCFMIRVLGLDQHSMVLSVLIDANERA